MLQLDGYDIVGDNQDREVEDFLNRFLPTSSFKPFLTQFWPGWNLGALTNVNGYQWGQQFRLNKFYWPSGASRWAFGHYLVNSDTVEAISADAFPSGQPYQKVSFSIGNPESNNGTINAGETLNTQVYVLPPTPLSGIRGLTGMTQSLYLLTIVDARYFWNWYNFGIQTIDYSTTWDGLFQIIASLLNVTINTDTINSSYLAPSIQAYTIPYEPIPLILDSLCYNVGHRFVANYNGTYATQLYQTALTALNTDMANNPNRVICSGGQRFASPL